MAIAGDEAMRQSLRRQRKELKMRDEVTEQLKARESELEQVKAKMNELDAMVKIATDEVNAKINGWNETRRGLALNFVRLEGAIMALKVALGTVEEQPIQDAQRLAAEVPQ